MKICQKDRRRDAVSLRLLSNDEFESGDTNAEAAPFLYFSAADGDHSWGTAKDTGPENEEDRK